VAASTEGRALGKFRGLRSRVADLDARIAVVTAHRDRIIAQRDRKHDQIPLSEREWKMWEHKIAVAQGTIDCLTNERRALLS
jgi:hypothetical protein